MIKLEPELIRLAQDKNADQITPIHALWSLESLGKFGDDCMAQALESEHTSLIREGIRSLVFFDLEIALVTNLILPFVDHPNAQTRAQVLRTLDEMGVANFTSIDFLVRSNRPEMTGQGMGGQYERRFERYLARKTLEE